MSVQDSSLNLDETAAESEDLTVRRLVRAIDYAEGFWLGLAKSNTPAQRRRLAALCRDLLEPLKVRVLDIELTEPVTDLLPILRERLAQEHAARGEDRQSDKVPAPSSAASTSSHPKLAIFVHGLEHSIPSREAYPPLLSSLNLNRELFRNEVPHPLLLWLPDYALTALARKAPDFWAWRSGLYEFAPEREIAEQSLATLGSQALHVTGSLSESSKRERLVMLQGLLDDYREMGDGLHEQMAWANILNEIGLVHEILGQWDEAKKAYLELLTISRNIKYVDGEAVSLHNLAGITMEQGELEEAQQLYQESLKVKNSLDDQNGIAKTLHQLSILAKRRGNPEEARRLCSESLEIKKRLGDEIGVARSLHQMAMLAQDHGELEEAHRLYYESMKIKEGLGDHSGLISSLHGLGRLAQEQGDLEEARRLFDESLEVARRLGYQQGVAYTLGELGNITYLQGDYEEAQKLYSECLIISKELGDKSSEANALVQLAMVAQHQGALGTARQLGNEGLKIKRTIGDQYSSARILLWLGTIELLEGNKNDAAGLFREALDILEKLNSPDIEVIRQNMALLEIGNSAP